MFSGTEMVSKITDRIIPVIKEWQSRPLKPMYPASMNVIKKWTQRYRNWDIVLSQLGLLFDDRLAQYL
jgi:transposase-like protein